MVGAYVAATVTQRTGSFLLGLLAALPAAAAVGMLVEVAVVAKQKLRCLPRHSLQRAATRRAAAIVPSVFRADDQRHLPCIRS
jgi:branched-subunit amino acid ABC-type transport system permease component